VYRPRKAHLTLSVLVLAAVPAGLLLAHRVVSGAGARPPALAFAELIDELAARRGGLIQAVCRDLQRAAVVVPAHAEEILELDAPRGATLHLEGCSGSAETLAAEVRVTPVGGEPRRHAFAVTPWWGTQEVRLGSGGRLSVTLANRSGEPVYFSDLHLRWARHPPPRAARVPRLLLISIDTLRADALGWSGGAARTPHLDRLAREGEIFERHYSAAHWTRPSHATMLSGLPSTPGAPDLHPEVPTLAERFAASGFRTMAWVQRTDWLAAKFGFSRGFEEYHLVDRPLSYQVRSLLSWLQDHRDVPSFVFLHTFDAHSDRHRLPYEASGSDIDTVDRALGLPGYGCAGDLCASVRLRAINRGRVEPLPGEGEVLRLLYDRGIEDVDRDLGLLFDQLRALGLFENMLVAVTSDHGEEFLEHGRVGHASWYDEVMQVPLAIKWPGGIRRGTRHPGPTASIDLAPTLLEIAGVPYHGLPGMLLPRSSTQRTIVTGYNWPVVVSGGWKAVLASHVGIEELYHLPSDPHEQRDLAAAEPARLARLRQAQSAYQEHLRALESGLVRGTAPEAVLTPEEIERLRALGYGN
jgi:choline-sulfatase